MRAFIHICTSNNEEICYIKTNIDTITLNMSDPYHKFSFYILANWYWRRMNFCLHEDFQ